MLSTVECTRLVARYPVSGELAPRWQPAFRQAASRVETPAGQALFDVGGACRSFLMILSGSLRVIDPRENRELLFYRSRPGESCTLAVGCLLGNSCYPARGVVDENLTAVVISQPFFEH